MKIEKRYVFAGHAIGAAARFVRLDELRDLNHVVPVLGPSVLPVIGGKSNSSVRDYKLAVDRPRPRVLFSVGSIETSAEGREVEGRFTTNSDAVIENVDVLEKLHVDRVEAHVKAVRTFDDRVSRITLEGNKISGLRLGRVEAVVEIDEDPFREHGTMKELASYYKKQSATFRKQNCWRFNTPSDSSEITPHNKKYTCSLVKKITLNGPPEEREKMKIDGYTIIWSGFGKIILGEVLIREYDKRVTLIRLKMGSDGEGEAAIGEGQSNGQTEP